MLSKNYLETFYINDESKTTILIIPGGGYAFASNREGTPVAKMFNNWGYHAIVYRYRNTLLLYPEIYTEAKQFIDEIINDSHVKDLIIIGFSAGGHMASYLLTQHKESFKAGILAYPVISSNPLISHKGSFDNLLGSSDEVLKEKVSTENLITEHMPPIFIWHTATDKSVPVENSLIFYQNLLKKNNRAELHIYDVGEHGLSIVTEEVSPEHINPKDFVVQNKHVSNWTCLLKDWLKSL